MVAYIEFDRGIKELPTNVRLLRSRSSDRGSAVFRFEDVQADTDSILGMTMVDDEGELTCRNIQAKFLNGEFRALEVIYEMESQAEWDRFLRFMQHFSADNDMNMGATPSAPAAPE